MSAISAIARLRSRCVRGTLRRFHWAWAPFVLTGLLAGPCTAAYAALEESVAGPQMAAIEGSWIGQEHGHSHHSGHQHVHDHEHQAGSHQHPATLDEGCCFGVKAAPTAAGKSPPEPEPPSHAFLIATSVTAEWLTPPLVRTMARAVDRSELHQPSPPIYLVTRRIRD